MRYDAFISYSHAADGQLAPALQKALQRLAKPWYRRRSLEVFRDQTGLAVDPHLWAAIVRALDDSEWFLLLTSPQAANSVWVNREIEHWKANRSLDRILPVLTEGHWQWDPDAVDFTADSDAVPPALRGVFTDEPRHLDLRWAREDEQLDLRNSRFRDAVAEVAAPLHGRTKDDIEGEDVRQHRRTLRIARAAVTALILLTVAAVTGAGIAVYNANRAEQRRIQAEAQRLAAQSGTELERPDLAFLLAAHGYQLDHSAQTESALLTSVANLPEFKQRIPTESPATAVALTDAADRVWIGTADGTVLARRFSDGSDLGRLDPAFGGEIVAMAPARRGSDAVVATDGVTVTTVGADFTPVVVRAAPDAVRSLAVDPATGRIAAGTVSGDVVVWEPTDPKPALRFPAVPDGVGDHRWVTALAWTPDGALLAAGQYGGVRRFNLDAPGRPVWEQADASGVPGTWVSALAVVDDGTVVTGATDGTIGFWSAADGVMTAAGLVKLHADEVRGLAVTGDPPEAGSVASVSDDGFILYWNHLTGEAVLAPTRVDEQGATAVAWDPANPLHGVVGGTAGGALLLDYGPDQRRPLARPVPGWADAIAVALSPGGDRLAVATAAHGADKPESELVLTTPGKPDPTAASVPVAGLIDRIVFTPDGRRVLASTTDGTVAVWDGAGGSATVTPVAPSGAASQLAVDPDGATVATRSMDTDTQSFDAAPTRLWRLDGEKLIQSGEIEGSPLGFGLAFTPDGSRLVIGGSNQLIISSLSDGARTTVDIADDQSRFVAVSPDGKTVAVALWSGPVRLIDVETGKQSGDDLRVAKRVTDLAFHGAQELVGTSEDGSIIFWDLATRTRMSDRPLTAVSRDAGQGFGLAPSLAVGEDIAVTASVADGRLVTWSLDPSDWIAEGCAVHRRELTDAEKSRYGLQGSASICGAAQKN
ncbi:TIR domain-containing protein [Mycobacterium pinniadriaticum]|uniref:TIR domain-containing protein n=2 Tax=Mycobacterium pinniadriaticum TaxID=2994102 RepID=A0ABT3SKU0_9MYCO|nr:TIR domain-containing protein [Mycobacterium pinniadriaticum]MCX2940146.1 TIR domain-containing protein [Mycobacterium pinniadriaticum]